MVMVAKLDFLGGGEKGGAEFHQILWEKTQNGPEMMFWCLKFNL